MCEGGPSWYFVGMEQADTAQDNARLLALAQRLTALTQFPYPNASAVHQSRVTCSMGRALNGEPSIHLRIGDSFPHSRLESLKVYELLEEAAMSMKLPLSLDGKQGRIVPVMPSMEGAGAQFVGRDLNHLERIVDAVEQNADTFRNVFRTIYLKDNAVKLLIANSPALQRGLMEAGHVQIWDEVIEAARASPDGEPAASLLQACLSWGAHASYADVTAEKFIHRLVQDELAASGAKKAVLTKQLADIETLIPLFAPSITELRSMRSKPILGEWTQDAVNSARGSRHRGDPPS